ncbi:MAG: class I SAM-dependent methyltransferase [Nitrospirae bacterium]|nr:class I SAM-dependent methyltransferase [Nitrospirota bacterium]
MKGMREILRRIIKRILLDPVADTIVKRYDKQLAEIKRTDDILMQRIDDCSIKIDKVETRLINYYRNRWDTIDNLADYLVNAEIPGDFLEFGVFQGTTFSYACKILSPLFKEMKFVALDSFEGLPKPQGLDAEGNFSSGFYKGQFACAEADFIRNIENAGVNMERVKLVKGWFDRTLTPQMAESNGIDKIAAAWIDCDLYESTVPVLSFITPYLSVGSVILFDDWRCFRNLPDYGQQRACREWLDANPQIVLKEFISFGFHGQSFTVRSC